MYREFIDKLRKNFAVRLDQCGVLNGMGVEHAMGELNGAISEALAEMMDRRKDTIVQNTVGGLTANDLAIIDKLHGGSTSVR